MVRFTDFFHTRRGGGLRFFRAPNAKIEALAKYLKEHVAQDVEYIMTDELPAYPKALRLSGHDVAKHRTVNHSAEVYVDGNTEIESAFSRFKRGVIGSFHEISIKHLHRYLSEFETRFNARKADDRFEPTLPNMLGIEPMPYVDLVAAEWAVLSFPFCHPFLSPVQVVAGPALAYSRGRRIYPFRPSH